MTCSLHNLLPRTAGSGLRRELFAALLLAGTAVVAASPAELEAQTTIRIMPPERAVFAVGQLFDIRVEATGANPAGAAPQGLTVTLNGEDITGLNILDPGLNGELGAGGSGSTREDVPAHQRAYAAPQHTTNFLVRDRSFDAPGTYELHARTADGAEARVTLTAEMWMGNGGASASPPVRNIILLVGDGLGASHRTAARMLARSFTGGKPDGLLAMDRMEVTGMSMTPALNSVITDSAPGMAALSSGHKSNNNQLGVYPDNTIDDAFDNPRVEYIGELMRRTRGEGFNVGIVTTADVTDATPAGNAIHTADRNDGQAIAARFFDERNQNAVRVLLGGGRRQFLPRGVEGGARRDERPLLDQFVAEGFTPVFSASEVQQILDAPDVPDALLGLFHPGHMAVAFDKVGAGRYSEELADPRWSALRDQPMLEDLTRLALRSLEAHSPEGFYLMVEGASIDKQAHAVDAERTLWDVIEFDHAVQVALDFADRTNNDDNPDNNTLVIVTADHETGGMAVMGVGNERYAPATLGRAVRDYAAVFRFLPEQELAFFPDYERDDRGYPLNPDPPRKLLMGWGASPDRYENWISNRRAQDAAVVRPRPVFPGGAHAPPPGAPGTDPGAGGAGAPDTVFTAVANPARSGPDADSDNRTMEGAAIPGFLVEGVIENRSIPCPAADGCPADTQASALTISGHTGSDVPLSASGPRAMDFTGTYDNTAVFLKMLRAMGGGER